ncbi:MAG: sigma-54 dependent transcriptional regulator [Fuerstiella sp.]
MAIIEMKSESNSMNLLIVDDDDDLRSSIARRLQRQGHSVHDANQPTAGIELARNHRFDVALIDLLMPEMTGIELLGHLKEINPACQVVVLTGEATVETAVEAMRLGAYDYVRKPCPFDELHIILQKAWERHKLGRENEQLRAALQRSTPASNIIGDSQPIQKVLRLIARIAPTDSPVMILGESGTGKELVARALHENSSRVDKPMVTVNCAALQESLLESELFGHEKGAFTGATAAKLGLFEVADGGTLFVDELGELAPALQAKLLRVLEDGSMRRVGSTREQKVDVRIIAATNRNLRGDVEAGRFREDLFYRINVLSIDLPPLRDRRDDIGLLIDHFLRRSGRPAWQMSDDAREALCTYHWPGNIRELSNVIERATILADDQQIRTADLPDEVARPSSSVGKAADDAIDNLEERERRHVARILERQAWNRKETATALGITRRSLYRLIEKYQLVRDSEPPTISEKR